MVYYVDDGGGEFLKVEASDVEAAIKKALGDEIDHMADHFQVEVREDRSVPGDIYSVSIEVVTHLRAKRVGAPAKKLKDVRRK
jgi:hypothetical protein